MHRFTEITSPQNPRVKDLARLREGKHRRRTGMYAVEGLREVERAARAGESLVTLYICKDFWLGDDYQPLADMIAATEGVECFAMSKSAFQKVSNRENPDGLIAVAAMRKRTLNELNLGPSPLVMLIEHVEKPGNLGTLLRNADGAGADAVIVTDPVTDLYSPQTVRASQGSVFAVQTAFASNAEAKAFFTEKGIQTISATPDAQIPLWEANMTRPTALLLGSEADGLSDFWMNDPGTVRTKIPMCGKAADSLNVSAAAAIYLFEAVRQRQ